MRNILSGFALVLLFAGTPAEARRGDRDGLYSSRYPSCGTQGCMRRHESGISRGYRSPRSSTIPRFRSFGSRSRY